jgi:hypothetical protein
MFGIDDLAGEASKENMNFCGYRIGGDATNSNQAFQATSITQALLVDSPCRDRARAQIVKVSAGSAAGRPI